MLRGSATRRTSTAPQKRTSTAKSAWASGDVAAWKASLAGELAPATVTRCLVTLKKVLADAMSEGLITASPAVGVKPPRPGRVERRVLTVGELARLEEAIDLRWAVVVPIGTTTGLRVGELAALRVRGLRIAAGEVVLGALEEIVDHRKRRGVHHHLPSILALATAATLAGVRSVRSMSTRSTVRSAPGCSPRSGGSHQRQHGGFCARRQVAAGRTA